MLTLMLGTMILVLTFGVFWHDQPARRRPDDQKHLPLPFVPRVRNSIAIRHSQLPGGKARVLMMPSRFLRPALAAVWARRLWRRILAHRAGAEILGS